MELLTRDEFRAAVFERDRHECVVCHNDAQDAHHIIERRLFDSGGYFLENGASLCGDCHVLAEQTALSCDEIRQSAGIKHVILPPHLYRDNVYDKWGNIVLPNGSRIKGELFGDESVQKILRSGGVLGLFQKYVKYPRTYHLPWSPGATDDDRVLTEEELAANFTGRIVVVTEKMDGENTTMYSDYIHARSLDSGSHPSREWVKNLHAQIRWEIPEGWRLCGENLFAKHTLHYDALSSYLLMFSIWNDANICLSWEDTETWAALLGLYTVPVIWTGIWDRKGVEGLVKELDLTKQEGYVVRVMDAFAYGGFRKSVAKYVRREHVGTSHNWMMRQVERNALLPTAPPFGDPSMWSGCMCDDRYGVGIPQLEMFYGENDE